MNSHKFDIYFNDGEYLEIIVSDYNISIEQETIEIPLHGSIHRLPGISRCSIDLKIITRSEYWAKTFQKFPSSSKTGFIMVDRERQILYDRCFLEEIQYSHDSENQAFFINMNIGFIEMITGD